jgi:hypothetical protein
MVFADVQQTNEYGLFNSPSYKAVYENAVMIFRIPENALLMEGHENEKS